MLGGAPAHSKSPDRAVRNLGALQKTASTSRVLNLIAIEALHGREPEYAGQPFFRNRVLNGAVILKHRLRADERTVMGELRPTATKVILPFVRHELHLGGRSMFVGQAGWIEMLAETCGMSHELSRDVRVLEAVDELPSLDPFLMREQLKRRGFDIARCYFAISTGDLARMQAFVSSEINKLISLAFAGQAGGGATAKLVELLLSAENDERLEPLRLTLRLEGESYREGVFCWRGFLYYKWVLSTLWPKLEEVIGELAKLKVTGPRDAEMLRCFSEGRTRLQSRIETQRRAVLRTLQVYDEAFKGLTVNQDPLVFRDFLLKAPQMFITLGDRIGVISHIASFWRYRFAAGSPLKLDLSEAVDIVQEFEAGLAEPAAA
jgi:hypothetical protein